MITYQKGTVKSLKWGLTERKGKTDILQLRVTDGKNEETHWALDFGDKVTTRLKSDLPPGTYDLILEAVNGDKVYELQSYKLRIVDKPVTLGAGSKYPVSKILSSTESMLKESTLSGDIETANPTRLGMPQKRTMWLPPSATRVIIESDFDFSAMLDFLLDLPLNSYDDQQLHDFDSLLSDIACAGEIALNEPPYEPDRYEQMLIDMGKVSEASFFARQSGSLRRSYARKWYKKNAGKLKAKRDAAKRDLHSRLDSKKKEDMRKRRKTLTGRPRRKYMSTKKHDND